jgi:hypothetical protein
MTEAVTMIDPTKAPALAHIFVQLYKAERRGRLHEAQLWKLAVLALLTTDHEAAA